MFNSAERVPMTVGDIREPMQAATFSPNIKISDSCCISATRKETTSSAISKSSILSTSQAHLRRLKLKYISLLPSSVESKKERLYLRIFQSMIRDVLRKEDCLPSSGE